LVNEEDSANGGYVATGSATAAEPTSSDGESGAIEQSKQQGQGLQAGGLSMDPSALLQVQFRGWASARVARAGGLARLPRVPDGLHTLLPT
jgi:hypothetical protein